jgi:hypothetical protein
MIYILEFKVSGSKIEIIEFKVSGPGEKYVSETQKVAEIHHLTLTQGLTKLFNDTLK